MTSLGDVPVHRVLLVKMVTLVLLDLLALLYVPPQNTYICKVLYFWKVLFVIFTALPLQGPAGDKGEQGPAGPPGFQVLFESRSHMSAEVFFRRSTR